MSITIALTRCFARADQFVTAHEPLIRSLTLAGPEPVRQDRRQDLIVIGILGGFGALVLSGSVTMIALRYYGA